jgi:cytochrome d ubiquinol oxidase subunit II
MATVWFVLIAAMLVTYVVLDGFDFGAGILHLVVARTDAERRAVLASIGPVWDANEVWLLAAGGTLVFAFPRAYAVGFSGFYLPLMMSLWLLILRGIAIEFRSLEANRLWRSLWDGVFCLSSSVAAIVLGAALGNVIRGVPIDASGYFSGPLFTNFLLGPHPGVLDWYTVLVAVFALLTLAAHGATYLWWKTTHDVQRRSYSLARRLWWAVIAVGVLTTIATNIAQPALYPALVGRPWSWVLAVGIVVSIVTVLESLRRKRELSAFLASAGFIASLLAATAVGLYPVLLSSTLGARFDLTTANAATASTGLLAVLAWWTVALFLAIVYFTYLFRSFRGKVVLAVDVEAQRDTVSTPQQAVSGAMAGDDSTMEERGT